MAKEAPPAYETTLGSSPSIQPQGQANAGYAPIQYDLAGQDPQLFYGELIDASNHPSEILCRMSDALFFHLNQQCDTFRGTMQVEPAKISWLAVALGNMNAQLSAIMMKYIPGIYDAGGIPYTFNDTQLPVLDRRGYLHLVVFELRAHPADSHQQWNKILNILKLHDPMTNLPFPTPIPRSSFPLQPDLYLNQALTGWQVETSEEVNRQVAAAQLQTASTVPVQQKPMTPSQLEMYSNIQAQWSRTRRIIIQNMGGSDPDERRREQARWHRWT